MLYDRPMHADKYVELHSVHIFSHVVQQLRVLDALEYYASDRYVFVTIAVFALNFQCAPFYIWAQG